MEWTPACHVGYSEGIVTPVGRQLTMSKTIPNFLSVFEGKLELIKQSIKAELKKPKKDRKKAALHSLLQDAKKLRQTIKRVKDEHTRKCPHCGKEI